MVNNEKTNKKDTGVELDGDAAMDMWSHEEK